MHRPYSCFFKYSLLERLFVIYNVSNLDHKPVTVFHLSRCTWPCLRDNWIMLAAFTSISSQISSDVFAGFSDIPCKILWRSRYTSNVFILFCHKTKFPLTLNFSTSNLFAKISIFDISSYRHHLALIPIIVTRQLWYQLLRLTIELRHQLLCTPKTMIDVVEL